MSVGVRLLPEQIEAIRRVVREVAGERARVFLFGSRTDPEARGGDIDLLVQLDRPLDEAARFRLKLELLARLYRELGERKIDLVIVADRPQTDFERQVIREAVPL
ncbi:conserved hypothetical protein [Methylomarinovum caldicuralii]|uniref:Polymerase beta nucleotidyltransferase domain-containing protein n=1 Tax=Methylomarinovum caldicuralii TaxID=438856 RepID=A0AAU9CEM6_9GAMM|nr:nucleotidyltransferase domain-containing protein [Methylomarinovum caldicuralii]BCX81440.1 conserved hypothetical protein [Methylomarinovum caldicuralii]